MANKNPIADFLAGYKTYITAGAVIVATVLNTQGITIPEYVWPILAAIGLGSLRAAVNRK